MKAGSEPPGRPSPAFHVRIAASHVFMISSSRCTSVGSCLEHANVDKISPLHKVYSHVRAGIATTTQYSVVEKGLEFCSADTSSSWSIVP